MSGSKIEKVARRFAAGARMATRKFQNTQAPVGLAATREGVLGEAEAVAISATLPGWLNTPASLATLHFLDMVPFGPVVEIGVHRGKYLSILRARMGETCRIVGYDIFNQAQAPLVEREFTQAFGVLGNIALVQTDSTKLTPEKVMADCGGSPVFFSIDGSHEADPVLSDIRLAEKVLDDAGIVAMDDVLNPVAIGVNEAIGRHLSSGNAEIAPFAYVSNKLFCCRPHHHADYLARTEEFIIARGADPSFAFFYQSRSQGDTLLRRYFGHDVLIASG